MLLADEVHDKKVVANVDNLRRDCLVAVEDLARRLAALRESDDGRPRKERERAAGPAAEDLEARLAAATAAEVELRQRLEGMVPRADLMEAKNALLDAMRRLQASARWAPRRRRRSRPVDRAIRSDDPTRLRRLRGMLWLASRSHSQPSH